MYKILQSPPEERKAIAAVSMTTKGLGQMFRTRDVLTLRCMSDILAEICEGLGSATSGLTQPVRSALYVVKEELAKHLAAIEGANEGCNEERRERENEA